VITLFRRVLRSSEELDKIARRTISELSRLPSWQYEVIVSRIVAYAQTKRIRRTATNSLAAVVRRD